MEGQNSFESPSNGPAADWRMPSSLGRSVSADESLVARILTQLNLPKPQGRPSGGRDDSNAWENLLAMSGDFDFGAGRNMQQVEEDLVATMPTWSPFGRVGNDGRGNGVGSSSGSGCSRSSSRKARLRATRSPESTGLTGLTAFAEYDSLGLRAPSFQGLSSSGESGGGGPGGGGGHGATANAGGGSSSSSSNGGGASWEYAPRPVAGAGGAISRRHSDILSNEKIEVFIQPAREPSFNPDREISEIDTANYFAAGTSEPALGPLGVQAHQQAPPSLLTPTTPRATPSSASGVFVSDDVDINENGSCNGGFSMSAAAASRPSTPSFHGHYHHANADPIAPTPAPLVRPKQSNPAPAHSNEHQGNRLHHRGRKPSYGQLASLIPDFSKLAAPPAASPLHTHVTAVTDAAPGGAVFPIKGGFAPAAAAVAAVARIAAAQFPPADSSVRQVVCFEDGAVWTRQAAIARYLRKKKNRRKVEEERKNDPIRQLQNKARERQREAGKFKKKTPEFISIVDLQRAASSRSGSGELPLRESTRPPATAQERRGAGRSVRARRC